MEYPKDFLNKIICGDCLEVMKDIPDGSVDMIITDPPYGNNYQSNRQGIDRKKSVQKEGDIIVREKFFDKIQNDTFVPLTWIFSAFRVMKNNSALYVFCSWNKMQEIKDFGELAGFKSKNFIILRKSNHGMGDLKGQYAPTYEGLLYFSKGRHILHKRLNDVIDVPVKFSGAIRLHPNEKPVSWFTQFIENSSEVGSVLLDPFIGSGTTALACKSTGRNFVGIDISEEYCKTAEQRLEEYGSTINPA